MHIIHNSVASLLDSADMQIRSGDLETPLEMIQAFVQQIVSDPMATARVISAPALDDLCLRLGALVLSRMNLIPSVPAKRCVVYVATEFYRHGGHSLLASDFVRNLPESEHIFLLTDVLSNPHRDAPDLRLASLGAKVEIAPAALKLEKLKWLLTRFNQLAPEKIYWLSHHQDAVAIAAAQPTISGDKYFIHHGDHNLALGVHASGLRHVDVSNISFFNCRKALGITNNLYWPLVCDDLGARERGRNFIETGSLRTCTSGSSNKFEIPYLFSYADIITPILNTTGGEHVHIGHLSEKYLDGIRRRLAAAAIPQERFIHIPWVPSLWRAMIDQNVDVYLTSWPISGGKGLIEAMGAGIPPVSHVNYISRHHGGFDLAPVEAPTWRTPNELISLLRAVTPESLTFQSLAARAHYEKHHKPDILASLLGGEATADPVPIPLRDYHPDRLQIYLDECTQRDKHLREETLRLEQVVAERDGQVASLNEAILAMQLSRSWRVTAPFRWFGKCSRRLRNLK
jgi:hypothetical protein